MTLADRIAQHEHATDRRACRNENCEREAIREGAFCSTCTDAFMGTGRLPKVPPVPLWMKVAREHEHGLARDETRVA